MGLTILHYLHCIAHSVNGEEIVLFPPRVISRHWSAGYFSYFHISAHIYSLRNSHPNSSPITLWLNISGELREITLRHIHTTQKLPINFIYLCPITVNENENQYNPNLLDRGPVCFHAALPALEINYTNWKDCYLRGLEAAEEDGSQRSCC